MSTPKATPILLLALACSGRNINYEWEFLPLDTGPVEVQECGDESQYGSGFRIEGLASALDSGVAMPEGMCVTAIDPTPAISGGEPTVLASSTTCEGGEFVVAGIAEAPAVGVFVVVDDCAGAADTVMLSATGIGADKVTGLGDGDALSDVSAQVITLDLAATWDADLTGYDGDLATEGFLGGTISDSSSVPVAGATVACPACIWPAYYGDEDSADGWFATGGTLNASTTSTGLFVIPAASVGTYSADDGGAHTWTPTLFGSLPGYAVLVNFDADS